MFYRKEEKNMEFKFIMKNGYHETEFIFDTFAEGCFFMQQALESSKEDVSFTVVKSTTAELDK